MDSHDLMRILIPDNRVKAVSELTGLSTSLLYQERRPSGTDLQHTGTRNTIDRLDLICEFALPKNANAVRIVGERYAQMYRNFTSPITGPVSVYDLLASIARASKECGEALAAVSGQTSLKKCTIEVAEAKAALENALALVTALEEQNA